MLLVVAVVKVVLLVLLALLVLVLVLLVLVMLPVPWWASALYEGHRNAADQGKRQQRRRRQQRHQRHQGCHQHQHHWRGSPSLRQQQQGDGTCFEAAPSRLGAC